MGQPEARVLWVPSQERIASARLTDFTRAAEQRAARPFENYAELHAWSVADKGAFWSLVWEQCGVRGDRGARAIENATAMPGARFFPDAMLNFADNVLARDDDGEAVVAIDETGDVRRLTWREFRNEVSRAAAALRRDGVAVGDRVAGVMANTCEAVVAALAAHAIGAVWSSCSPDFGVEGIVDRFGQIEPVVLIATAEYSYGGKRFDNRSKIAAVAARLPSARRVVLSDNWAEWLGSVPAEPLRCVPLPFAHPIYILFSSGTTGVPKCIVHGAGGTLLQHLKEHQLHCDIKRGDRVFYFTTCGWMMWNWLITSLASGATVVLYDGSPFHPNGNRLFDLVDEHRVTLFGTSAKFIDAVQKAGLHPRETHALTSLRTITSTGSPLSPESFEFVYDHIKRDVHLASISGGTDIVSCFVGGVPTEAVRRGEIQAAGLGMDVDCWSDAGTSLVGEAGELVCKSPFPSMPVAFWNDPSGAKYRSAYFDRFPGIWCHGDWVTHAASGGWVIAGRSDATLNPGGVRIGTAEIYRQVEQIDEVLESLAVGQQWDGDERVVLFVRLRPGVRLDDPLRARIAKTIRTNTSPRHVPARIVQVADIPRTKSGKIVELAVRHVIHGRAVANIEALANPEALELFRGLSELEG